MRKITKSLLSIISSALVLTMALICTACGDNVDSSQERDKKKIINESNYTYRDALEVGAYLIETGKFERLYKEMQIYDLQKELDALED